MSRSFKIEIAILFILVVFISGCQTNTIGTRVGYTIPENLFISLENSLNENSYTDLKKIFSAEDYPLVLKKLFFDTNLNTLVEFGFPSDNDLSGVLITTNDLKNIKTGRIKFLDEDSALTAVTIKNEKINLFAGVVIQKINGEWKITRMYDFLVVDSSLIDANKFYLDFFKKQFNISLVISENILSKGYQTTFLYNTYLDLESIEIVYQDKILCNFTKDDVILKSGSIEIEPQSDTLFTVDEFIVDGSCDYSSIVVPDLETKYFLEINFKLKNNAILKAYYYGDLRL